MSVVSLRKKADEQVVSCLRTLLTEAEAGRLTGVIVVGESEGGTMMTLSGKIDRIHAVGRLEMMKVQILGDLLNGAEQVDD